VLGSYITLIPSGAQFKAKCPFHQEKTASFSVSPERGAYYCFGCGAKGDIFTFVEQFEGLDFKGALKLLADRAGVSLTDFHEKKDDTDELYAVLEKAAGIYQELLLQHQDAQHYLFARGLTQKSIDDFRIGYVPEEWRYLVSHLSEKELSAAERAGLLQKKDASPSTFHLPPSSYYDRFRGRIMFPLFDGSGRVIAFSGRLFPDSKDPKSPKYINSPETPVFHKSRILYGFNKAKESVRRHGFSIVVEGQFDLVLSHQYGFTNTVATSGTAVSDDAASDQFSNLSVLSRLAANSILAFDGDAAGIKARTRAALVELSLGMQPKVAALPEGEDPASLLAKGDPNLWKAVLKESKHVIMAEAQRILAAGQSMHAKVAELTAKVFPLLARVASSIEQRSFLASIAHLLGMQESVVAEDFKKFLIKNAGVQGGGQQREAEHLPEAASLSAYERLFALLKYLPESDKTDIRTELESLVFETQSFVVPEIAPDRASELLFRGEREFAALSEKQKKEIAAEFVRYVRRDFYDSVHAALTRALRDAEERRDEAQATSLLRSLAALHALRAGA
jgi:DNA primase